MKDSKESNMGIINSNTVELLMREPEIQSCFEFSKLQWKGSQVIIFGVLELLLS